MLLIMCSSAYTELVDRSTIGRLESRCLDAWTSELPAQNRLENKRGLSMGA